MKYGSCPFPFILLSMILSRSIHVVANGRIWSFLMAEQYSIVYVHIFVIQSSMEEHLGCVCLGHRAGCYNEPKGTSIFTNTFKKFRGRYPEKRGHMVAPFLIFLLNLSTTFHSGCTSLHSYLQWLRAPFCLHPLQQLFLVLLITAILTVVRWYVIVVSIWISLQIVKLSIFSYICWPFVCLLGRSVRSGPLTIFKLNCLFLLLSRMSSLYILNISHSLELLFANIFFHSVCGHLYFCFSPSLIHF